MQLLLIDLATIISSLVIILGAIIGVVRWFHKRRWRRVRSAQEQELYLQDQLEGATYADGPFVGTVTDIDLDEDSGIIYRIKKLILDRVEGTTEFTVRFDRANISENRLNREPFSTLFSDPSQADLVAAEHAWTKVKELQACTL